MRQAAMIVVLAGALGLSGCSGLNDRNQKMLSGAAIGAGVGAVGTGVGYIMHENEEARK